jgi:hypothetical protein
MIVAKRYGSLHEGAWKAKQVGLLVDTARAASSGSKSTDGPWRYKRLTVRPLAFEGVLGQEQSGGAMEAAQRQSEQLAR